MIHAKKSLGQNFLHDKAVLARIAALALPDPGSGLVEIGPGTGNLTAHLLALLPADAQLTAIERDRRLLPHLAERFPQRLAVVEADAADVAWPQLLAPLGPHPVVVGNLPYYAALPILFAVLAARPARMVFMVQKEVAERLVANPGTPAQGQISVKIQMVSDVALAFKVGPGAFTPAPSVDSAVVVFRPLAAPRFPVPDLGRLNHLISAGFSQRRKTLVNAAGHALHLPAEGIRAALAATGVDERIRAEALTLRQWARLAQILDDSLATAPRETGGARGD